MLNKYNKGKINNKKNIYEYEELYSYNSKNNIRIWNIFIRIIDNTNKKINNNNWEMDYKQNKQIKKEYFNPEYKFNNIRVEYWTESGIINNKIIRYIPMISKENKRQNKFTQAIIEAGGKYNNKLKLGYKNKDEFKKNDGTNKIYFPMLLEKYNDKQKLNFPIYIQPKLDGIRCISYLKKNNNEYDVILYSRNGKEYKGFNYLKKELKIILIEKSIKINNDKYESLYIDGELYKHGLPLQIISGITRNIGKNDINKYKLEYHIFDNFYPSVKNEYYCKRKNRMDEIKNIINKKKIQWIKNVPTFEIKNIDKIKDINNIYKKYIQEKYEGIIIRECNGIYKTSNKKINLRSKEIFKKKPVFSDEYEIIDFVEGRGSNKGAIVFILKTKNGKKFNIVPNWTLKKRKEAYIKAYKNFEKEYKGKMMTISYQNLSKDKIPLRAKGIEIRDYE